MINASELRIGNYLLHNNQITKIWSEEILDIENKSEGSENFNAIPLSPEILEACGFDKQFGQLSLGDFCYLAKASDDGNYYLMFESCSNNENNPIKYLHQLQNLYFALTGSELMIDEQKLQRSVATTAK